LVFIAPLLPFRNGISSSSHGKIKTDDKSQISKVPWDELIIDRKNYHLKSFEVHQHREKLHDMPLKCSRMQFLTKNDNFLINMLSVVEYHVKE
jgi:hypothetical protein